MAVPASADIHDGIVNIQWSGIFDRDDVTASLKSVEQLLSDKGPVSILIRNQVRVFHFNAGDAKEVASQLGALQKKGLLRTCMVVNKPVHYGIGRMINAFCEMAGVGFGIFWDEDAALLWLRTGKTNNES